MSVILMWRTSLLTINKVSVVLGWTADASSGLESIVETLDPISILRDSIECRARDMVFNAIFNNISVILWGTVLLVEETGVTDKLYRNVVSSTPRNERDLNCKD
jgi:hypothetical protein